MIGVRVAVTGAAVAVRDDARPVPWREARLDKLASVPARMVVEAVTRAWPRQSSDAAACVGVYLVTGETGLDVEAFLEAAQVAWDERPDDPDYRWLGGRALRAIDPYYSLRTLANGPSALLAMHLGATGPAVNIAHDPYGVAWTLLAALDDLSAARCDVAVVCACDMPSLPSRRAVSREEPDGAGDEAAALILRRSAGQAPTCSINVRWEPGRWHDDDHAPRRRSSLVRPLRELVEGHRAGWAAPVEVVMDGCGGRAVVQVSR